MLNGFVFGKRFENVDALFGILRAFAQFGIEEFLFKLRVHRQCELDALRKFLKFFVSGFVAFGFLEHR